MCHAKVILQITYIWISSSTVMSTKCCTWRKKKIPLAMACSLCYFWAWVLFPSLSLRHSIHGTQVPACHQLPEEKICSMWFHMIAVCLPAVFICLIFSDREEKCRGQHIYIRIGMISRYICMYLNT